MGLFGKKKKDKVVCPECNGTKHSGSSEIRVPIRNSRTETSHRYEMAGGWEPDNWETVSIPNECPTCKGKGKVSEVVADTYRASEIRRYNLIESLRMSSEKEEGKKSAYVRTPEPDSVIVTTPIPITFYKKLSNLEDSAYNTLQKMSKLDIPIEIKLSFDKCLSELKKVDLIEKFIPSNQKELIRSINNSAAAFFSEYAKNKELGKEYSNELFASLYSNFREILEIRAEKLGVTLKSQKIKRVDTYYLDYWSEPFVGPIDSATHDSPNRVRIELLKSKVRVLLIMVSQIDSKNNQELTDINEKSIAINKEINLLSPISNSVEKIELKKIYDQVYYEINYAARRIGTDVEMVPT